MKKIASVLLALLVLFTVVPQSVWADPPAHAGTGGRPDHAKGHKDRNDPDDDGHGPDRGDGTRDDEDWNNGCGNDEDRDDDNEGWCGKPKPEKPIQPKKKVIVSTCKLIALGETPELFPLGWEPEDGEKSLIAEAHDKLEYTLEAGQGVTVFFWTEMLGHTQHAHYEEVTCLLGEDILVVEREYHGFSQEPQ